MKRFLFLFLMVMLVARVSSSRHARDWSPPTPPAPLDAFRTLDDRFRTHDKALREAAKARQKARLVLAEAREEVQQAIREAREEVREAFHHARGELDEIMAGTDGRDCDHDNDCDDGDGDRDDDESAGEVVDGIPVPIVPGTRLIETVAEPPAASFVPGQPLAEAPIVPPLPPVPPVPPMLPGFPGLVTKPGEPWQPVPPEASAPGVPVPPKPRAAVKPENLRVVVGLISITEERAVEEARKKLEQEVADWLEPHGVPRSWRPSLGQIGDMIVETKVKPVVKDYGTLYEASLVVDVSPERRTGFIESYSRRIVLERMALLGAGLAFLLICLAAISGYIRADEATRGYYTNRLRFLTVAGVAAAGAAIYHFMA